MILAKLPVAGRVKTRLGREIGVSEATRFYRATSGAVLNSLGRQPFWQTIVSISPDSGTASPMLGHGIARMAQGGGDLGQRMHRPMRVLPPGPVCLIGTDVPGITVADIRHAFRQLGRADAVFGPAEDGGFWLVGFRRRPRTVAPYRGVTWSRPDTLARVLANLQGLTTGFTTRRSDVDDARDLARFGGVHGRRVQPIATRRPVPTA